MKKQRVIGEFETKKQLLKDEIQHVVERSKVILEDFNEIENLLMVVCRISKFDDASLHIKRYGNELVFSQDIFTCPEMKKFACDTYSEIICYLSIVLEDRRTELLKEYNNLLNVKTGDDETQKST